MSIDTYPAPTQSLPSTVIGYAQVTANQGSITASNPGTDLTGLSITFTARPGRRYRVTGHLTATYTVDGQVNCRIIDNVLGSVTETFAVIPPSKYTPFDPSAVYTPSAGVHTVKLTLGQDSGAGTVTMMAAATYPAWIMVEDITGDAQPASMGSVPVGVLGQAISTSPQGSITSAVDLTDMSVNVVVPAGRTLKITFESLCYSTVADDVVAVDIYEDTTRVMIRQVVMRPAGAGGDLAVHAEVIRSPSAGAHTYKVQARRSSGTGTITFDAGSGHPRFLLVEDITPTPAPAASAPSATLGYAQVTATQAIPATTETDLTGLSVTVTVPDGRRLRITGSTLFASTANATGVVRIREGTAELTQAQAFQGTAGNGITIQPSVIVTPAGGVHTYKLTGYLTGAGNFIPGATYPAFILVEDITAQSMPIPASTGFWLPGNDFPSSPAVGDLWFENDTKVLWAFNGAQWDPIGGLKPYFHYGLSTGSTSSSAYVDFPGPIDIPFTKRAAHTELHVHGHVGLYKTVAAGVISLGLRIDSVDWQLTSFYSNEVSTHRSVPFNFHIAADLAAGTYTARLRWLTLTNGVSTDSNDRLGISIMEVLR